MRAACTCAWHVREHARARAPFSQTSRTYYGVVRTATATSGRVGLIIIVGQTDHVRRTRAFPLLRRVRECCEVQLPQLEGVVGVQLAGVDGFLADGEHMLAPRIRCEVTTVARSSRQLSPRRRDNLDATRQRPDQRLRQTRGEDDDFAALIMALRPRVLLAHYVARDTALTG